MKSVYLCLGILALCACSPAAPPSPTLEPTPSPLVLPTLPPVAPTLLRSDLGSASTPPAENVGATPETTPQPTRLPPPYAGTLEIEPRRNLRRVCLFASPEALPSQGVKFLSHVITGDCQNGEIGVVQIGDRVIAAQSGFQDAAFTLTDVTDPTAPQVIGVWEWNPHAATLDLKPFHQGDRWYLALAMQRAREGEGAAAPCGIGIVEITNVREPKFITRLDGDKVGSPDSWCNVHTLEVDTDEYRDGEQVGNAAYFVVSDVDTFSARIVDIRDLQHPREVNFYHLHAHPHAVPDQPVLNYVHDSFVSGDKVYLANWLAGVVILDKGKLERGEAQEAVILKPTEDVAPGGLHVHYVVPSADGNFLFIEDELNADNGLRLLDIRDPAQVKTVWVEKNPGGVNAPHNFVLRDDVLYAGWYNDGVRMYRVSLDDPNQPQVTLVGFQEVRANKNIDRERYFDGVWGVRVRDCLVNGTNQTCIYASDMSSGLSVMMLES